jgi:peptidoglycan hydrolase-like protein with peptidoglycan-binding domain
MTLRLPKCGGENLHMKEQRFCGITLTLVATLTSALAATDNRATAVTPMPKGDQTPRIIEAVAPDSPVAAAQAFLRSKALYNGRISGILDPETAAALRRFQIIHGLRVSGTLDAPTQLAMRPDEPGKTDENVQKSDHLFLENLAQQTASEPQIPQEVPTIQGTRIGTLAQPTPPANDPAANRISSQEVEAFLRTYLQAAASRDVTPELQCFAPKVNFFGKTDLPQSALKKNLTQSRANWASRRFHLRSYFVQKTPAPDIALIKFTLRYQSLRERQRVTGLQHMNATLTRDKTGTLKIAALSETPQPENASFPPNAITMGR